MSSDTMAIDIVPIIILVFVAGLSGLAGYWGRIVQKLEDKRDQIYLSDLPALYSSTSSASATLELFGKGGSIDQLSTGIVETNKNLGSTTFSGNILIFEPELREELLELYSKLQELQIILKQIEGLNDPLKKETVDSLRSTLKEAQIFQIENFRTSPKELQTRAEKISNKLMKKLKSYHSYSWKLTITIFVLSALVALFEIIKGFFSP